MSMAMVETLGVGAKCLIGWQDLPDGFRATFFIQQFLSGNLGEQLVLRGLHEARKYAPCIHRNTPSVCS